MKERGHVTRSRRLGMQFYCDRVCFGLDHRVPPKTAAQRKAEKRAYDAEYRKRNRAMLKAKKAAYFQRSYDPDAARVARKKRAHIHAAYCRRPEYRAKKHAYDVDRYAQQFGDFADAHKALMALDREIGARMSDYDIRTANGTLNKRLQRKREHEQASHRR